MGSNRIFLITQDNSEKKKKRSFSKNKNVSAFMCTHVHKQRQLLVGWGSFRHPGKGGTFKGFQEKHHWVCLSVALHAVCPWREMWQCTLGGILESRRISFHRNKSKSSKLSFLAHSYSYSLGEKSSFAHFVTCLNCRWQTWRQYYEQRDLEQVASEKTELKSWHRAVD